MGVFDLIDYDKSNDTHFCESTVNDSIVYKMMNTDQKLLIKINDCIKKGQILDESYVQEQIFQIQKTHISPLYLNVLDAFSKKEIVLVYSKEVKVPQAIPFIVAKMGGTLKAFVFVSNYGSMTVSKGKVDGGNYYNIPMKHLYALMEGAYITLQYYKYPQDIRRNLGLMKTSVSIYVNMFIRILNREYALSLDQDLFNRVCFSIGKFFLTSVWEGENPSIIDSYAMSTFLNPNRNDLSLVGMQYDESNITSLADLIIFITNLSPRLSKLNLRYFVECYINMYHAGALLGIDTLPYFIFNVTSSLLGAFIINQPVVSDILKNTKGIQQYYPELSKIF